MHIYITDTYIYIHIYIYIYIYIVYLGHLVAVKEMFLDRLAASDRGTPSERLARELRILEQLDALYIHIYRSVYIYIYLFVYIAILAQAFWAKR